MRVLTEADLRSGKVRAVSGVVYVEEDVFVTPTAKEYLKEKGLCMEIRIKQSAGSMPYTPILNQGNATYVDLETGAGYAKKPEFLTHIRGNILVPKNHPRIAFRGKLDSLQAQILLLECQCCDCPKLKEDLEEVLVFIRRILAAEVKEEALGDFQLLGLSAEEIRSMSHQVKKYLGIQHPIPDASMGRTALELNALRTQIREAELLAASVLGETDAWGILAYLNRLSSAVYILFCRVLSDYYKEGKGV